MSLIRFNPFREMEEMLDRYARTSRQPFGGDRELVTASDWAPAVDISEDEQEYLIKVEIPEVKKEDVKVTVDNGILTIKGERRSETEEKDAKHHRVERFLSFLKLEQ